MNYNLLLDNLTNPALLFFVLGIFAVYLKRKSKVERSLNISFFKGFIDHDQKEVCYSDHEIFERYHKFKIKSGFETKKIQ